MEHSDNTEELRAEEEARQRKQFAKMTETPVPKLVVMLGIPTMLNMMVSSFYNLADTYFVSGLGENATGAVNVVLSLMALIQAIGFTFGMGGGSIISRLLGKRAQKEADEVSSSAFFAAAVAGTLILVFGLIFLTPLMRLLGSTESILPNAKEYSRYILIAAPFMCMSFVMNNLLRSQGKAFLSMIGLVTGAVINVALDPLFIFVFDMGVTGAAVATFLSQMISFFILLFIPFQTEHYETPHFFHFPQSLGLLGNRRDGFSVLLPSDFVQFMYGSSQLGRQALWRRSLCRDGRRSESIHVCVLHSARHRTGVSAGTRIQLQRKTLRPRFQGIPFYFDVFYRFDDALCRNLRRLRSLYHAGLSQRGGIDGDRHARFAPAMYLHASSAAQLHGGTHVSGRGK